jgi:nucleoside 2-deoxyribosyltransferase
MRILVAGGFDSEDTVLSQRVGRFCQALGKAVSKHGHILLNGCRTELDRMIAEAAYQDMHDRGDPDPDKRVISYLLAGLQPLHSYGTIIRSRLTDWDIKGESFYIPEQMQQADAVILVGGFDGTFRAANWARIANKPLLPFTAFGGAAQKIYAQELNEFDQKYSGLVERLEYEQLNSVKSDWDEHAADLIALAEKVAQSRSVLVIMSYADLPELEDAYDSFVQVCEDLGYRCERVTEANAGERILPDILARIERAAFVIVDLTDLRPNVFYELGYADGLGKKAVITAKAGTELPFDVKDMPTICWSGQRQLRENLRQRIISVVKPATAAASPPIGQR